MVNGKEKTKQENLIIADESGNKYISLEKGAELIGHKYFNGEYGKNEEDKSKCYLQNENEAIGFQLDSEKIYKVDLNKDLGQKEMLLNSKVTKSSEGSLYVTLEDFSKALNVVFKISEDGKQIEIQTCDHLAELKKQDIEKDNKYKSIDSEYENLKAIYYGMIIVSDGTNLGVVDSNLKTIIGTKYKTLLFNEYTQCFIGQSNNKYGVLSKEGKVNIEFKYDDISIINYSPLLYKAKQNNKYGVLDANGNAVVNIEYDAIGYDASGENGSVLIISNINDDEDGIVVQKDGEYGVVNIKTGEVILKCELEKIYTKTSEDNKTTYYIQIKGYEYQLEEYIKYIETTTVVTN